MKNIFHKLIGALCFTGVLVTFSTQAALIMSLDLGSGIPGELTNSVPKNQVEVLAWSWGMSNSGSTPTGGGGGAPKASFQDLSVTKYVDKSSPLLMLHCAKGDHIDTVTLYVRKAGAKPIDYIKIVMTDVLVTNVSTGGSGGEDRLTENTSLNFSKVEFDYTPLKPDGTPDTVISFNWDIAGGTTP